MKLPQTIAAELRRLTSTRMSVLALLALLAVPVLYGGLYLWANQDPYARFPDVPVALVVEDEGAIAADGEAARNIGDEVADQLVEDAAFDWHRVSSDEAAAGLDDATYDFAITLPAEFSAALASLEGDDPHQAEIVLSTNDATSTLAGTIGEQAVERIRAAVAEQVGREAASMLLDSIHEIRGALVDAADGASRLADGAATATDGAARLTDGARRLAAGSAELADGTARLADGSAELAGGAAQVADGNAQLAASADLVGAAVDEAASAVPEARHAVADELAARGVDPATIDAVLARLDPLGERVATGNERVHEVVGDIDRLADGSRRVADGSAELAAGASTAADGAARLSTGAARLQEGAGALESGLAQLEAGAGELHDGLADGAAAIPDTDQATRDAQASTIADPIALETDSVASAGSYGAGLAPFFAALAGWIGIYALFLIVKPVSRRAVTALHSPVRITLAGWLTPAALGAVQMGALFLVLAVTLGFPMSHPVATLGVMLLASATYAAIILALNVWLGSVGQFLGLVLMVLQLVTAGGTFPWQTLPAPLAALHQVLPMGYVVDAMRQVMYGGDLGRAGADSLVLVAWLGAAFVVAAIGVTRMTHFRTLRDLQPSLIG
ncbi:putative membrane protein [Agromyces flavus]|uniref:Membrane protein n=1 Tax=Agromyces flavus TaxID=589382 RepID=A0A1H1ZKQ1_9MICO|nr:YhgE/Pip domain-containing protein [Agromyces flavus]MCP2367120.1 putative membrane protein [Agromyces flavus]GGI46360.1 ABC transporter [Agromyces flavus]SDT33786.1 putative membrane protein [Agromyces flavus]